MTFSPAFKAPKAVESRICAQHPPLPGAPQDTQRLGILMICLASLIFAVQDAVGRHLASAYPAIFLVMLRYWFFALFAVALVARSPGGLTAAIGTPHKVKQVIRGLLLAANVTVMLIAFVKMGIVETHAVFTVAPLLVVALSGPVLGERVGWRRWTAIAIGFAGILVILQPGLRVLSPWAALPVVGALLFAGYALLTRQLSSDDGALVNFFWAGVAGAAGVTALGLWFAQPIARADWPWVACLCLTGAAGHYALIRAYELAEASSLQPFSYTQLVWVSLIGFFVLGERVAPHVVIGMAIVVAAGLFTWWQAERQPPR